MAQSRNLEELLDVLRGCKAQHHSVAVGSRWCQEIVAEIERLRVIVSVAKASCATEHNRYKGTSGNLDSYNEGRSDAGDAILDAIESAEAEKKAGG